MSTLFRVFRSVTEGIAALMMAAIFCTFMVQIAVRYAVGSPWFVQHTGGFVDAAKFGWTVEFILVLWLWTIFFGCAFIVRDSDHVTFDILYNGVGRRTRTVFAIVGAVIIMVALWASIGPTYDRMKLLRLKSSATLPVKMLPIYSIYFVFLAVVGLRYLWRAIEVARHGADRETHVPPLEEVARAEEVK